MKKKLFSVMMAATLVASLTACGKKKDTAEKSTVYTDITAEEYQGTVKDNSEVYKKYINVPDYKGIEVTVDRSTLDVSDDDVEQYINSVLTQSASTESKKEGVTATGDTVTLDYSGKKDGVAFSGGTATDVTYTIGSKKFITDLDEGLAGLTVGKEYDIPCTFPSDYSQSDLAGQNVIFTVTVTSIQETIVPELTDEWVANNAASLGSSSTTVADLRTETKNLLIENNKSTFISDKYSSIWNSISGDINVSGYPEEELNSILTTIKDNAQAEYQSYATVYGVSDFASYLSSAYGFSSEDEFNEYIDGYAKDYLKEKMFVTIVAIENNITVSADEIKETGKQLASYYGYDSYDAVIEQGGKEINSEIGYQILYQKVQEFICDNAKEV